jgi:hypothetical protein
LQRIAAARRTRQAPTGSRSPFSRYFAMA